MLIIKNIYFNYIGTFIIIIVGGKFMKTFKPKAFIEGKITPENCKHELLSTSGFEEGMYGTSCQCIICGAHLHYGPYSSQKAISPTKFVFKNLGILTQQEYNLIKVLLEYISKRYIHEKAIDIASIFKTIYPFIQEIACPLQRITNTDRKITQEKYRRLFRET